VLSICSTLLVVVKPPSGSPVIQFAHFSVKEYLMSARLAGTKETISRFHISMRPAHIIVAQACLGVLLHLDENITADSLKDFPLAEYAAEHWVDHARVENVSSNVVDEMKRLFDPSKSHLSVWVWIYGPEDPGLRLERSERPAEAKATSLHYAAVYNMHSIATFLIVEHSQDVNARRFGKMETPLHVSSRWGSVETARVLLKHGAETETRDGRDYSPLDRATSGGHVELAQVLLEHGADANARDEGECTPLYLALSWKKTAVARVLLSHGADVNAQLKYNETILHQAYDEEVARLLLERAADANALDSKNRTPLHRASEFGRVGAARVLLEHGVDANVRDINNATPLHLASNSRYYAKGSLDVVRLLLQYDSDIHVRDDKGRTPFMRATAIGRHDGIMQLLLVHGAEDHRV
jgi:ankyrin repeat protein